MKKCPKDIVNRLKCWWDSQEERCGESHVYCRDCPLHVPGYSMEDAVKDVIAYVYRLEAAQPKWISVEERLPDTSCRCLVMFEDGHCCDAEFDEDIDFDSKFGEWVGIYDMDTLGFVDSEWRGFQEITHWMPLPEPPKEENDA